MAVAREIWRYPVKSMAGERLEHAMITEQGIEGDRRWALVDGAPNRAGKPLTIRQHEALMTYRPRLANGSVALAGRSGEALALDAAFIARIAHDSGRDVDLRERPGGNFDDSPLLIVNLATVARFAAEAGRAVDHRRFRANLYIDGIDPEAEVEWLGRRIRAGEAEIEVTKRCERCVVITRDPDTTDASPELLRLLVERHDECMGVYCQVVRPGDVAIGDSVGPI